MTLEYTQDDLFLLCHLGLSTTVEFMYELQYQSNEIKSQLESLVDMHLVERKHDTESGLVTLIFNTVFAPNKPMR